MKKEPPKPTIAVPDLYKKELVELFGVILSNFFALVKRANKVNLKRNLSFFHKKVSFSASFCKFST